MASLRGDPPRLVFDRRGKSGKHLSCIVADDATHATDFLGEGKHLRPHE
jgi:hypothetical protein